MSASNSELLPMLPLRWQTEISVRSYELDFYGVVNNAVYLHYLEEARLDLLRQLGIDFFQLAAKGVVPVVARVVVEYKIPVRGGNVLAVHGTVEKIGGSSMELHYTLASKKDGEVMAQAETLLVFVNSNGRPMRVPAALRTAMAAFSSR